MTTYKTVSPNFTAVVNADAAYPWQRNDFAYLGIVTHKDGWSIGWAWHLDGRSIDRNDRAFDLIDFPQDRAIAETVAADG